MAHFALNPRAVGLPIALVAATGLLARLLHPHYPIDLWLFWRYAGYWAWCALFAAACLSGGHLALTALWRQRPPRLDRHLVLAFATGLLLFYLGMFVAGLLALYGRVFALLWPAALVAAGGPRLVRHLRPRVRRLLRARPAPRGRLLLPGATVLFGVVGVGMMYFPVLTPSNLGYDALWYHLPIAEHYAAEGAVRRFQEGWYPGALPHLSSFLYTWAFLLPNTILFDRIEIAAHLEFTIFVASLASVPALVRWLVPGVRAGHAWAATFLFPGVLLYDSSLTGGADHIAAFWAVPIMLTLVQAWRRLEPRDCVLLAAMLAGAVSTKVQGALLAALPVAAIAGRALLLLFRRSGCRVLPALGLAVAAGLLLTAPHWLKNWLWYGDPVYPFLSDVLPVRPWTEDSAQRLAHFKATNAWAVQGTLPEKLRESAKAMFTFSFVPHDWPQFHRDVPVFGSLFTLSLIALPFLRGTRRVWALAAATHVGLFIWYWVSHQDRYLQVLRPWMVCATAAVLALVWRTGLAGRVALAPLVALQVIWGGDVYFFPTHGMVSDTVIKPTVHFLSSGFRKDTKDRLHRLGDFYEVGRLLPPGAKVLVHESHLHLGLGAPSVSDWATWQGGISYGRLGSPQGVYELLRRMGVTHLVWTPHGAETDSVAGDVLFLDFASRTATGQRAVGGLLLAEMPPRPAPPPAGWTDQTLFLGCPGTYQAGLYPLSQLTMPKAGPTTRAYPRPQRAPGPDDLHELVSGAWYLVHDPACHNLPPAAAQWRHLGGRGPLQMYARER